MLIISHVHIHLVLPVINNIRFGNLLCDSGCVTCGFILQALINNNQFLHVLCPLDSYKSLCIHTEEGREKKGMNFRWRT